MADASYTKPGRVLAVFPIGGLKKRQSTGPDLAQPRVTPTVEERQGDCYREWAHTTDTEDHMTRTTKRATPKVSRTRAMAITLGDLISAAYEAVPGAGSQKLERAMRLLTQSPLARHLHPHVEFVR
jgi:hypothetical protein